MLVSNSTAVEKLVQVRTGATRRGKAQRERGRADERTGWGTGRCWCARALRLGLWGRGRMGRWSVCVNR